MKYVGVSGFVSRAEVDFALSALPAGLTLMVGVLASPKSISGVKNAWHKRYAAPADISSIFSPDPRCLNLLHWSDDKSADAAQMHRLRAVAGPYCHGFQLNVDSWPLTADAASEMYDTDIVLQFRPGVSSVSDLVRAVDSLQESRVHVLFDGSGGRGRTVDMVAAVASIDEMRSALPSYVHYGVAGGLCAETLGLAIRPALIENRLSIDAEGRLRDGDEGGTLNLDKVSAYLRAAGEVMQ